MSIFESCMARNNERLHFFNFPHVGLKAIVAVNSTVLGPAVGGCRMRLYTNEEQALEDVLRLSEGMTYKNSIAGIDHGGGKACIIADHSMQAGRKELFNQFGKCLKSLSGTYYSAEDMGTSVQDVAWMQEETDYVCGTPEDQGGAGDPSPWTAKGVVSGMQAARKFLANTESLEGLKISIQGVGHVGEHIAKILASKGAKLTICDTSEKTLQRISSEIPCQVVGLDEIYDLDCDIYSPCAVGQTVNPETLKRLKCKIIAGAANNQLTNSEVYSTISERGILYCPDFVINSGGVINVAGELCEGGYKKAWVEEKVSAIQGITLKVLEASKARNRFTEIVAIELAKERIDAARK